MAGAGSGTLRQVLMAATMMQVEENLYCSELKKYQLQCRRRAAAAAAAASWITLEGAVSWGVRGKIAAAHPYTPHVPTATGI